MGHGGVFASVGCPSDMIPPPAECRRTALFVVYGVIERIAQRVGIQLGQRKRVPSIRPYVIVRIVMEP
jgi:hypothetical protein